MKSNLPAGLGKFLPLDEYEFKARLIPGVVAVAPALFAAMAELPDFASTRPVTGSIGALVYVGLQLAALPLVRGAGLARQRKLYQSWGGKPTTAMLRHRDARINAATKCRLHDRLRGLGDGFQIPTAEEEAANPDGADVLYEAAADELRVRAKARGIKPVQRENIGYGKARNLFGLKPFALGVSMLAVAAMAAVVSQRGGFAPSVTEMAAALATLVIAAAWVFGCTPEMVRRHGEAYAYSLFEAAAELGIAAAQAREEGVMMVEIFDVEHGACTLITTTGGQHVLIDCGHKAGTCSPVDALMAVLTGAVPTPPTGLGAPLNLGLLSGLGVPSPSPDFGWRPSEELKKRGIAAIDKLIVSNYDEDHVSDLPGIRSQGILIWEIVGNPTVTMPALRSLKPNGIGNGVAAVIDLKENFGHTFSPREIRGVDINHYWVIHDPRLSQNTNDLSLVTFLSINDLHMIFPGDIESMGWQLLLQRADFLAHLKRVNVFVASHHGRENGYHADVFKDGRCSPVLVIISDKSIMHGTQENAAARYGRHASGLTIGGQSRKVLTTRNDGQIRFQFDAFGRASVNIG